MRFMIKTIKVKKSWTTWLVNSEKVASNASRSLSVPSRSFKKVYWPKIFGQKFVCFEPGGQLEMSSGWQWHTARVPVTKLKSVQVKSGTDPGIVFRLWKVHQLVTEIEFSLWFGCSSDALSATHHTRPTCHQTGFRCMTTTTTHSDMWPYLTSPSINTLKD